jgi:hypothetical protein
MATRAPSLLSWGFLSNFSGIENHESSLLRFRAGHGVVAGDPSTGVNPFTEEALDLCFANFKQAMRDSLHPADMPVPVSPTVRWQALSTAFYDLQHHVADAYHQALKRNGSLDR